MKNTKVDSCRYGPDGKVQKTPVVVPPPQEKQRGLKGKVIAKKTEEMIVEKKKDEMKDYMEAAAKLIHTYVPPNPALIQKAKDAGNMSMSPPQGGPVHVEFKTFIQPADLLGIDVDAKALLLGAINVATYLEKPEEVVTLNVRFATLADGTSYTAQTTLDAKAKNIRVVIENAGDRPLAR